MFTLLTFPPLPKKGTEVATLATTPFLMEQPIYINLEAEKSQREVCVLH